MSKYSGNIVTAGSTGDNVVVVEFDRGQRGYGPVEFELRPGTKVEVRVVPDDATIGRSLRQAVRTLSSADLLALADDIEGYDGDVADVLRELVD
jgi:hypothetical protein